MITTCGGANCLRRAVNRAWGLPPHCRGILWCAAETAVTAQIHAGGRGKGAVDKIKARTAAGIHVVVSPAEIGATLGRVIGKA
jgi:copper oxidase (laccase) domain-containing protein